VSEHGFVRHHRSAPPPATLGRVTHPREHPGQRVLVTGASSGVGLEIARCLAAAGAEVVMPVRDAKRGARARNAVLAAVPAARIHLDSLDLTRLDSVRALTARLLEDGRPIDGLVLNAGVALVGDRVRHVTADGFELHFQTNFLGHAALVTGLLPLLERSRARVVAQGSLASRAWGVRWGDLQCARRYGPLRAYGSSKSLLGLFAVELARRSPRLGVGLAHPGVVPATAIAPGVRARIAPGIRDFAVARLGNRPSVAAAPALAALDAATSGEPVCFGPGGFLELAGPARARRVGRRLRDVGEARRVWELADRLLR